MGTFLLVLILALILAIATSGSRGNPREEEAEALASWAKGFQLYGGADQPPWVDWSAWIDPRHRTHLAETAKLGQPFWIAAAVGMLARFGPVRRSEGVSLMDRLVAARNHPMVDAIGDWLEKRPDGFWPQARETATFAAERLESQLDDLSRVSRWDSVADRLFLQAVWAREELAGFAWAAAKAGEADRWEDSLKLVDLKGRRLVAYFELELPEDPLLFDFGGANPWWEL